VNSAHDRASAHAPKKTSLSDRNSSWGHRNVTLFDRDARCIEYKLKLRNTW
jgi:hypothetical protein